MKRIFTLWLVLHLAMIAGGGAYSPLLKGEAGAKTGPTCCTPSPSHHKEKGRPDDENSQACLRCCLGGCLIVAAKTAEISPPSETSFRWVMTAEKGDGRNEAPPLPPPRLRVVRVFNQSKIQQPI